MEWYATSGEQAKRLIATGLRCEATGDGLRISAISECLRVASHLCSAPEGSQGAWEPASSLRLANMVKHRLSALWPDLVGDGTDTRLSVLDVLSSLAVLGDMVRLTGGWWLPAPAYAIRVDDRLAVLLGGGPMEVQPGTIALTARVSGRVRLVDPGACKDWADMWEADEWIGAPDEGLETWSEKLIAEVKGQLTDAPNDISETFAYWRSDWIRLADLPSGEMELILCRTRTGRTFSYFMGEFIRGNLKRLRSIPSSDARRLRFYLDVQATRPYRAKATTSQGLVTLRLARRLPEREARILLLGWQAPAPERERPGVTHHVFPAELMPIVRKAFKGLGIVLDERIDTRRGNK